MGHRARFCRVFVTSVPENWTPGKVGRVNGGLRGVEGSFHEKEVELEALIVSELRKVIPLKLGSPDNFRGKEVFYKSLIPCKVITLHT